MFSLWSDIFRCLQRGEAVVVATVVQNSGSTPRTSGSKMVVYSDGRISGTIGGGALEGDVIRSALNRYSTRNAGVRSYDLTDTAAPDDLDLICGGRMQVLIEYVPVDDASLEVYRVLKDEIRTLRPVLFVRRLVGDDNHLETDLAVLTAGGERAGSISLPADLVATLRGHAADCRSASMLAVDDLRYIVEPILPAETVYVVGAGHVSREIARLTGRVGFATVVIDDRPEFATEERFPSADAVLVRPDHDQVFAGLDVDADSCIVIVTRGHRFDRQVLAQALQTNAGYIGMIGSSRKRDTVYGALIEEGIDPDDLDRVHCPVGLDIEAETPAEIAVSIVAQLIRHRARQRANA